jgi:glycosyltransferase involved in cell wall biosynthesis
MRIAFLNPGSQMGGAEACLLDLLCGLRRSRPEWQLLLVCPEDGPLPRQAGEFEVETAIVPAPAQLARLGDWGTRGLSGRARLAGRLMAASPQMARYAVALRRRLGAFRPDVIHTNGIKMHALGIWCNPRAVPVVWHIHDFLRPRAMMASLLRLHARGCAAAICNSRSVTEDAATLFGDRVRTSCVYNGIDLDSFHPEGNALDLDRLAGLAPSGGAFKVGLLATMAKWKGHDVFLRAIARTPREANIRAYVIGGPLYRTQRSQRSLDELRSLAAELGIADRVGFTGHLLERAAAMRALDAVVHASVEPEPFGLVIVEAMACAKPVVVSYAGGARELVEPGVNALAHEPGNAEQLCDRIMELAVDPGKRQAIGHAGRQTAERRFDRRRMADEIVPVYLSVAGNGANSGRPSVGWDAEKVAR